MPEPLDDQNIYRALPPEDVPPPPEAPPPASFGQGSAITGGKPATDPREAVDDTRTRLFGLAALVDGCGCLTAILLILFTAGSALAVVLSR